MRDGGSGSSSNEMVRSAAVIGAVAGVLACTSSAHADELVWRDEWPHFRTSQHIASAVMGASVLTLYLMPRVVPRWGAPILFDDAARSALRGSTGATRATAARISTIAYWTLLLDPLVMQGPIVPLARGSSEVAAQVTLINMQSLAFSSFVFRVSEVLLARARPYVWDCYEKTGSFEICRERGIGGTNSLVSGHSAIAATGAALICTNQFHLDLYGRVGGPIACGASISLALATGIGRIVSDNHYASDVLAAWMLGVFSGWVLPSLLHYGFDGKGVGDRTGADSAPITIAYGSAF